MRLALMSQGVICNTLNSLRSSFVGSPPATAGAESRRQKELYNKEFNFLDYGFLNLNHPCAARAVDVRVE